MAEWHERLVEKRRHQDARNALSRVRAKPLDHPSIEQELSEIIAGFDGHERMSLVEQLKAVCSGKQMFYRFSFAIVVMIAQQMTGTNSINCEYVRDEVCMDKD